MPPSPPARRTRTSPPTAQTLFHALLKKGAAKRKERFAGDKTTLPGYIHSITSTENYIILPITSLLINPCKFKEPPVTNIRSSIQSGGLWGMDFYDMVPMR